MAPPTALTVPYSSLDPGDDMRYIPLPDKATRPMTPRRRSFKFILDIEDHFQTFFVPNRAMKAGHDYRSGGHGPAALRSVPIKNDNMCKTAYAFEVR
jgi:hypothetical protein